MNNSFPLSISKYMDYDPFGMITVGRDFGANYRFGFNGYENTDELLGENTAIDFGARIYDCRIARFFSTDPRSGEYPWQSVYVYYSNCPISIVDIKGKGGPGIAGGSANVGCNLQNSYSDYQGVFAHFTIPSNLDYKVEISTSEGYGIYRNYIWDQKNIKSELYIQFNVSGLPGAEGLQVIQFAYVSKISNEYIDYLKQNGKWDYMFSNDGFYGTYRFYDPFTKQLYGGFVDAGYFGVSAAIKYGGQYKPVQHTENLNKPYYNSYYLQPTSLEYNSETGIGFQKIYDAPSIQLDCEYVIFETMLVATNYMNSGKDLLLGYFQWGWSNYGKQPINNEITFIKTNQFTLLQLQVLKNDGYLGERFHLLGNLPPYLFYKF